MTEKDEYCISAGEFAKICQTTRDTLRYYERQGILVPRKDPVNGYHYYSYAQISSYYFIRTFRSLDCSVGDIREYLLGGEEVRFDEFVEQQYDKLLSMRMELDRKIRTIAGTRQILEQIRISDVGGPVIRKMIHSLYLILTEVLSFPAASSGEIEEDIRRHLHRCETPDIQTFPMGASIAKDGFMKEDYNYKNVFSFAQSIDTGKMDIQEMPPGEYLTAVCRESDGDIEETYKDMKLLLKKEKRRLISDVYSLSIVNVIDPNEERKYLKYIFARTEKL